MKDKDEQSMFDLSNSQVEKFNDNETESGTLLKDRGSSFGEIKRNRRGSKTEGIKSKLRWEFLKMPFAIITAVVAAVILWIIGL
ncbi:MULTISPECIES: hypothetical protein [unclassified Halomonas]|uniref:hypothetical protein n=1 Tax=unclassified Halomonas TaxID=2609666 RepID=UPI0020769F61|nr:MULTISPECIES: hypothetical protein [unclassified Halomonas]